MSGGKVSGINKIKIQYVNIVKKQMYHPQLEDGFVILMKIKN